MTERPASNGETRADAPQVRRGFFPFVDVLRAAAVVMVLVYHLIELFKWANFPTSGLLLGFRAGWVGVELFFVISGFVITLSCARNIEAYGARGYRSPFMGSRLARIVPLYALTSWCYIALVDPAWFAGPRQLLWTNILLHASFLHNLSPIYAGALNGPAWSIGVEMQFYVFMALVFAWLPTRRPVLLAALAVLAGVLWRTLMLFSFDPALDIQVLINRTQQLPGTFDAFGLGCMLALIARTPNHWAHHLTLASWRNFAVSASAALVLSTISWHIFWPRATYWNFPAMVIGFRVLLGLTFLCWLWAAITLPAVPRLLALLRPVNYIGKISYGIYLWHMLVIVSLVRAGLGSQPSKAALWAAALTLVISMFTWHYFEHPIMKRHAEKAAR